ncbi:alpha/beta hydrolase [Pseudomonas chlororaphis]|uniref:alpha/beta hydrolase n=1 Tax=Pseudomonas chlororaphis TaxID=587753 RepID=UPI0030CCB320
MTISPDTHWQSWSLAERERAYSPSSVAPGFGSILDQYRQTSLETARSLPAPEHLRYGPSEREYLTLFPCAGDRVMLYFHGGYWQELSAKDSLFPAAGLLPRGIAYAAANYSLAPQAQLPQIVEQAVQAVCQLQRWYRDRRRRVQTVIAGSSAGAHLAAMLLMEDWQAHGLHTPPFDGALLISGIYDLHPLQGTYIDAALKLDATQVHNLSPARLRLQAPVPTAVVWGEIETAEFKRQSIEFGQQLAGQDSLLLMQEIPDRNHFDIVLELNDRASPLGHCVDQLFSATESNRSHSWESSKY